MTDTSVPPRRWCSFRLGDDCFAVAAADVVEVSRSRRLTVVPLAATDVIGLAHLRGRIVPVIDAARRLGVARGAAAGSATHLVIALGDDWYGLAVDELLDVIEIPPQRVERPTAAPARGGAVAGTYAARERLVHLLDPALLIHSLGRRLPHQARPRGENHDDG